MQLSSPRNVLPCFRGFEVLVGLPSFFCGLYPKIFFPVVTEVTAYLALFGPEALKSSNSLFSLKYFLLLSIFKDFIHLLLRERGREGEKH